MTQLFTNNGTGTLASGITNVATSIVLNAGDGAKFPNPSSPDYFYATLYQVTGGVESNWEIVQVTARSTDTLTVVRGQQGTTALAFNASDPIQLRWTRQDAVNANLTKAIYGLTYANSGTDSIAVAAGGAMDASGIYFMVGAALTKNVTTAWAVGSVAGGLDTGVVGNSDYYIWAIARPDTGVVDYLFSLSSTAPTMPANYTYKRLIGWFKRVAAVNVAFTTYELTGGGIQLAWNAPTTDVSLANTLTTSRRTDALKVPLGFSTTASVLVLLVDSGANFFAWWGCPDETDFAPGGALPSCFSTTGSLGVTYILRSRIVTSSAGLMAARASLATVDTYNVSTESFEWARRN